MGLMDAQARMLSDNQLCQNFEDHRVPTPGSNVTRMIFGALNVRAGQ
jgi:hypothetical protein